MSIFGYLFERRLGISTITEVWLKRTDDVIRSELCANGYRMLDYTRTGPTNGGTALLVRDSLTVKNVGGGTKEFSDCSTWFFAPPIL